MLQTADYVCLAAGITRLGYCVQIIHSGVFCRSWDRRIMSRRRGRVFARARLGVAIASLLPLSREPAGYAEIASNRGPRLQTDQHMPVDATVRFRPIDGGAR